jgi:hypothetical protein
MKIFLIGGNALNIIDSDFDSHHSMMLTSASNLGEAVCLSGNDLLVCSPFPGSADANAVVRAARVMSTQKCNSSIEFYFPNCQSVEQQIRDLIETHKIENIRLFPQPATLNSDRSRPTSYDWLLSQLLAMENCNAVVALGGKNEGPASLLLRLAEGVRKPVLPFTFLGGAADQSYQRRQYQLQDQLGTCVGLLREPGKEAELISLLPNIVSGKFEYNAGKSPPTFFISYPSARPEEADFIEMILRRREHVVFRDERDFGAGQQLQGEIDEYIHQSKVFIVIWCQEYACSPWCFDELELALNLQNAGKLAIWLFSIDDTRIVPRNARGIVSYSARTRVELEKHVLAQLEKLKVN